MKNIIQTIKDKWQMLVIIPLMAAMAVFIISAFLTPKYLSEASIIVIQKHSDDKVDAFSAAKSAEYLSDILSRAIYTDTFFKDVMASSFGVENKFSSDPEQRKKEWSRTVSVKKINNTGIIKIEVLDPSKTESQKIAQAISWNLSANGGKYHGGGETVEIRTIDGPDTYENPSPNIVLNTALGFILGLMGAISVAFYWEDFDLRLFKKKNVAEQVNYPASESYSFLKR